MVMVEAARKRSKMRRRSGDARRKKIASQQR